MNGSGCWKWCNNYHFASEEQIFSLNETFSTPLLEQYINDKGGFWFHSLEILIFSCPIFCPNNWCQMFFQLLFCVVVIPEFQQECTDWHISFGSTFLARWARTLSFHVIFCYAHDWKITAEKLSHPLRPFSVFIETAFAILWGGFCYFLRNSPFKVGKNGLQVSLHLGNDDSLPCFSSQPLDTNQTLEKCLSCSLDSRKLDSIKIWDNVWMCAE